jgi:hypothetical protein
MSNTDMSVPRVKKSTMPHCDVRVATNELENAAETRLD